MIYTTRYIQIAIQILFNKQISMLIYVNQNNGKKINCSKINLNIKNINIIYLRKTNRLPTENPSTRKPDKKKPVLNPASIFNSKEVI